MRYRLTSSLRIGIRGLFDQRPSNALVPAASLAQHLGRHVTSMSSITPASILRQVESGDLSASEAEKLLQERAPGEVPLDQTITASHDGSSFEPLESYANLDHGRARRTGFPEAVFAAGKTPGQIAAILDSMAENLNESIVKGEGGGAGCAILATRVDEELHEAVSKISLKNGTMTYHKTARMISVVASAEGGNVADNREIAGDGGQKKVIVACAGTTDLPVAEEAALTLEAAGCKAERVYDVGVAGLHRILRALPKLRHADVKAIIVCAGMDGALPSVVAGLVEVPVIAVPTSVGYGASFGGVSAMLTMLNSCAPGVGVVNIDNGFGAAALAFKFLNCSPHSEKTPSQT
uniref:phosphoribosylaminoimidazole carboxylase n=1 Tax=Odontella aurita TaxID=265563 RepID=A0A7S4N708_9STRA|mmetsp:Transcript_50204/g.151121  ORF Transcript_50204/g.151121 Transcript_50204/m.151121 type:complete len:350 (+) Transcript_50204:188-1237(+)|eukprot:CAMPEP_0113526686 /NCGR_PEP_ID=MMETSP0015_2-20120614/883_1 /TAXON_ID=2838 /ORGANISM="Odontella" /LENGTH=349 /DNA_ID=CAMNT_0000425047 /DNA_START=82 /DNA_END=1131 /DNA_ORIENTATION=+ /assembly_acc=CAM_ASM_000160